MNGKAFAAALMIFAAAQACASGRGENTQTVDAAGIELIVVRSGSLDVWVSGVDDSAASIQMEASPDFLRVAQRREGARLKVWAEKGGTVTGGQIHIRAPRVVDLILDSSSGTITVDGMEDQTCSIRTISGGVSVHRVHGGVAAVSVSGAIELDATEGSVRARTVSGAIKGRAVHMTSHSTFESFSGSISIDVDGPVEELGLDLQSVSGSIRVGAIRAARGLKMGFGRTRVQAQTISGQITFGEGP